MGHARQWFSKKRPIARGSPVLRMVPSHKEEARSADAAISFWWVIRSTEAPFFASILTASRIRFRRARRCRNRARPG